MNRIFILFYSISLLFISCEKEIDYSNWYEDDTSNTEEPDQNQSDAQLTIMSSNIRVNTGEVGTINSWDNRKIAFPAMVEDLNPTLIGFQEVSPTQLLYLADNLNGYSNIGVGRNDGKLSGEVMAVFYDTEILTLEKWNTFWLSETPEKPSKGWDASINRCATWAIFKIKKDGKRIFVVNTHLDHIGTKARDESTKLLIAKIKELNKDNLSVIMTGDFNDKPTSSIFKVIKDKMGDSRVDSPQNDNYGSYNNFGTTNMIIDYIFYKNLKPLTFKTITTRYEGVNYISDHYPIMGTFNFNK